MGHQLVSDELCATWGDDGVTEGSQAVQPIGNPSIRSHVVGGGLPPVPTISCKRRHPGHLRIDGEHWFAAAVGVGKSEQSASCVCCTQGARRDSRPLRIEPEGIEVSEDARKASSEMSRNIFKQDVLGSEHVDSRSHERPQIGGGVAASSSLAKSWARIPPQMRSTGSMSSGRFLTSS